MTLLAHSSKPSCSYMWPFRWNSKRKERKRMSIPSQSSDNRSLFTCLSRDTDNFSGFRYLCHHWGCRGDVTREKNQWGWPSHSSICKPPPPPHFLTCLVRNKGLIPESQCSAAAWLHLPWVSWEAEAGKNPPQLLHYRLLFNFGLPGHPCPLVFTS